MLFKPWRSGLDLKSAEDTWDDAFQNHNFLERHRDNEYFNIRYGNKWWCVMIMLPRKDRGIFLNTGDSLFGPFIDDLDHQNVQDRAVDGLDIKTLQKNRSWLGWHGEACCNRLHQMMEMEKILLLQDGWTTVRINCGLQQLVSFMVMENHIMSERILGQKKASILSQEHEHKEWHIWCWCTWYHGLQHQCCEGCGSCLPVQEFYHCKMQDQSGNWCHCSCIHFEHWTEACIQNHCK